MRELADQGAAILFYSTDYDELIGCCDRVAIMYDGRIVRELAGEELNETNIVASSLNIDATRADERGSRGCQCLISRSKSAKTSPSFSRSSLFCIVYLLYHVAHPKGFSSAVLVQNSDEVFTLALVAMAQTVPGSRRRARPFGRRADDDGRLFRELSSERRAGRNSPVSRLRRMDARPRDAARRRARHPDRHRDLPRDRRLRRLRQRGGRRLWPDPADHRHAGDRRNLHRHRALPAAAAGRQDRRRSELGAHQLARRFRFDGPYLQRRRRALVRAVRRHSDPVRAACADRAPDLAPVQPLGHRADHLCNRFGRRRSLHVGPRRQSRADRRLHARRVLRRLRRPLSRDPDVFGQRRHSASRRLYVELDRLGRDRRHLASRRQRRGDRLGLRGA